MRVPKSQVFSVATFYRMLSTEKLGRARHSVLRKRALPRGRRAAGLGGAARQLDLEPGQTSPDGKWTLVTVSCLGVCGIGPVIVIDDDMYGNVTPAQVPKSWLATNRRQA
jgi:NADH-quinone oxidoreductase subunit E